MSALPLDPTWFIESRDGDMFPVDDARLRGTVQAHAGRDHLVLHAHGGLVHRDAITRNALDNLLTEYTAAEAAPMFLVWNSDLGSVLKRNLGEIGSTLLMKRLVPRVIRWVVNRYGREDAGSRGDGIDLGPDYRWKENADWPGQFDALLEGIDDEALEGATEADRAALHQELEDDPKLLARFEDLFEALEPDVGGSRGGVTNEEDVARTLPWINREVLRDAARTRPSGERGLGTVAAVVKAVWPVAKAVVERLMKRRGHGVWGTVVEEVLHYLFIGEVGTEVWTSMKRDGEDMFLKEAPFGPGQTMLEELERWSAQGPGRRLTLVGHSAGAVVLCRMLRALANYDVQATIHVVLLAPACTMTLFADTVHSHGSLVDRWSVVALSDAVEAGYWEVPALYPRSLLYLVSGVFEDHNPAHDEPLLGMGRFWPGEAMKEPPRLTEAEQCAVDRVVALRDAGRLTVQWAPVPADGQPRMDHGALDDHPAIMPILRALVGG